MSWTIIDEPHFSDTEEQRAHTAAVMELIRAPDIIVSPAMYNVWARAMGEDEIK